MTARSSFIIDLATPYSGHLVVLSRENTQASAAMFDYFLCSRTIFRLSMRSAKCKLELTRSPKQSAPYMHKAGQLPPILTWSALQLPGLNFKYRGTGGIVVPECQLTLSSHDARAILPYLSRTVSVRRDYDDDESARWLSFQLIAQCSG